VNRLLIDSGEEEPEAALRWDLEQHLVGSVDEYAYDFHKLASVRAGEVTAYLAAAYHGKWPAQASELMRAHKLVPHAVDLDIFGLINSFEANYADRISAPAVLVLGGEQFTKVIMTLNGSLVDFEVFKFKPDTRDAASYAEAVQRSVRRLVAAHARMTVKGVPPLYLAGMIFSWEKFSDECLKSLGDVRLMNPFRNIGCTAFPETSIRAYGPRLSVAVGLAVRESGEVGS
jgi:Tfp pilus assembly PilM family ATPase